MLHLNGAQGEGGGQILRTALSLSLITGTPFSITAIRAGRKNPGLARQHLACIHAAQKVSSAVVDGAELGSQTLSFQPGTVQPGEYRFSVDSAGSTTLIAQTLLPALILGTNSSTLILEGGTHNPFAPPFDFFSKTFLPVLNRMGPKVEATLLRPGFYPAGGGEMRMQIVPCSALKPLDLCLREKQTRIRAQMLMANLPAHIAGRALEVVQRRLELEPNGTETIFFREAKGPGSVLLIEVISDAITEIFTGFGRKGFPAERLANQVVEDVRIYLKSGVPVGPHLADQLLLPLALAGGSFRTLPITGHTETNLAVIQEFFSSQLSVRQAKSGNCEIQCPSPS